MVKCEICNNEVDILQYCYSNDGKELLIVGCIGCVEKKQTDIAREHNCETWHEYIEAYKEINGGGA